MTNFKRRGGLWVVSQAALVARGHSRGIAVSQEWSLSGHLYFRWNSAGWRREYRIDGRGRARQDHYPLPRAVGTSPIGPKRHFLSDQTPDLCRIGACVVRLGPNLAKLAGSADGLGAHSLPRRQGPARRRMAPEQVLRIPRIRNKRETIRPRDLLARANPRLQM